MDKKEDRNKGLVNYKSLERDILSSIKEGRSLIGKGGALTPLIKKLLEVTLEGEIDNHLSSRSDEDNRRNGRGSKTVYTDSDSFELITPRDRNGSFEPQIVKKKTNEFTTRDKDSQLVCQWYEL